MEKQTEQYNYKILELFSQKMDNVIMQIDKVSYFVYQDNVQKMLSQPISNKSESIRRDSLMVSEFLSWMGLLGFTINVQGVYFVEGNEIIMESPLGSLSLNNQYLNAPWYKEAQASMGRKIFIAPSDMEDIINSEEVGENKNFRFGVARMVFNTLQKGSSGVLLFYVEIPDIEAMMEEMNIKDTTQFFIVDNQGNILYTMDDSPKSIDNAEINKVLVNQSGKNNDIAVIDGRDCLINIFVSEDTNWRYVTVTDYYQLTSYARNLSLIIVMTGVIILFVSVFISFKIANSIVAPIKKLQESMNLVKNEVFGKQIPVEEVDEIGQLKNTFNEMTNHIEYLVNRVLKEEVKEKQAKLNELQSQINPHFLYNTLDTINSLAILNDIPEISDVSIALSDIFKYAVKRDEKLVAVADEIQNLKNYFQIQKYRFGERINFKINIQESLMKNRLLRFSVQPLVENAILHGLDPKPEGGTIIIDGYCRKGVMYITVADDGIGVQPYRLEQIQRLLLSEDEIQGSGECSHIGLNNVNERLKIYFNGDAGLVFTSKYGKGSTSTIYFPVQNMIKK